MIRIILAGAAVILLLQPQTARSQSILTVEDFDDISDWSSDGFVDAAAVETPRFQGAGAAALTCLLGDTWADFTRTLSPPQDWRPYRKLRIEVFPTAPTLDGTFSPTVKVSTLTSVIIEERRGGLTLNQWNTISVDLTSISSDELAQVSSIDLYLADIVNPGIITFYIDYLRLVPEDDPQAGCRTEVIFMNFARMLFEYWTLEAPSVPVRYRTRFAGEVPTAEILTAESDGVRYYYTAASSDYHLDDLSIYRDEAAEILPALDRDMCIGLYMHETATYIASTMGWDWPAAVSALDWDFLDRIAAAAKSRGKILVWSEPSYAWDTIYADAGAVGRIEDWGSSVVIMFATNFPDQIWSARENAYALAGRLSVPLGDSVQDWYFVDQGIPADRDTTFWLFTLGYESGARYFQVEGSLEGFHPHTPYREGIADFILHARDPDCIARIQISGVTATNITATGAVIEWNTDVSSDSRVEYGTTTAYGEITPLDSQYVTAHSVALTGLAPATVYNCRVRSVDYNANSVQSENLFFETATEPVEPEELVEAVEPVEPEPRPEAADQVEEVVSPGGGGCSCRQL